MEQSMAKITKFPGPRKNGAPKVPQSPQETIDVKNPEVEEKMTSYVADKTPQNLNALVEALVKTRVLNPATLNDQKFPIPVAIKNKNGETFLPIYTEKTQIPKDPQSAVIMNLPFLAVVEVALKNPESAGVVINPFSNNLILKRPLLERINEVETARREGKPIPHAPVQKEIKLTEDQYLLFERNRFEFASLPAKFFEDVDAFMETLSKRKEEYIDELFEESYQQKRMYPYLPEDFSVMALGLSESTTAIRLDMPSRDRGIPCSLRIYMVRDKEADIARYFLIEQGKEKVELTEMTAEKKHVSHGEAPVEGAELQTILDLIQGNK